MTALFALCFAGVDGPWIGWLIFIYIFLFEESILFAVCSKIKYRGFFLYFPISPYARSVHSLPFATVEAEGISGSQPAEVQNLGGYSSFLIWVMFCHKRG